MCKNLQYSLFSEKNAIISIDDQQRAVSHSLEAVSVLQIQDQAVGTQVHFVLGLRHLEVKQRLSEHQVMWHDPAPMWSH